MKLPDHEIRSQVASGRLGIWPFTPEHVQPASYDLTLSDEWLTETGESFTKDCVILAPRSCILGRTVERVRIPDDLVAELAGRSSIGRLFIAVHVTAGYVDPLFDGTLTLEIVNLGSLPRELRAGWSVAQLSFTKLTSACEHGYNGRYQGQVEPTPSRL